MVRQLSRHVVRRGPRRAPVLTGWRPWRWVPFALRLRWAAVRSWAGRRRVVRYAAAGSLVSISVIVTLHSMANTATAQAQWGVTATVAVLVEDRQAGDAVGRADVEFRSLPVAAIPADAIVSADGLPETARWPLFVGDVLRARDLGDHGAGSVPSGSRGIAISTGADSPTFDAGDPVELFVFDDAFAGSSGGQVDAISGRVLETREGSIVVAIILAILPYLFFRGTVNRWRSRNSN